MIAELFSILSPSQTGPRRLPTPQKTSRVYLPRILSGVVTSEKAAAFKPLLEVFLMTLASDDVAGSVEKMNVQRSTVKIRPSPQCDIKASPSSHQ
jgi:hypothetical protein